MTDYQARYYSELLNIVTNDKYVAEPEGIYQHGGMFID